MKYAGWNREKLGEKHYAWNHADSDTTVELYRYGVKSYIEIKLGTELLEISRSQFEFSEHSDASDLTYALLDTIQSSYRTVDRLEDENLGSYTFYIDVDVPSYPRNESFTGVEVKYGVHAHTDSFYQYINSLLNYHLTNHYMEAESVMDAEPYSMSESELRERRRKVKQEIREKRW